MTRTSPTLINVCGANRSGTTMLDLMLGNGENAFSCGEIYAWFRPWRKPHHDEIVCTCGEKPCPVWNKVKNGPEEHIHTRINETFGVDYIVDSSKELRWLMDSQRWASKNEMSVRNVLIYKNPDELVFSYWKRKRPNFGWRDDYVSYHKRILEIGMPFLAVSARQLSMAPSETLRVLCDRIGMPYFDRKEEFWDQETHQAFGSRGTREQVQSETSKIQNDPGFPAEFEKILPDIRGQIEDDKEISEVSKALQANDIMLNQHLDGQERFVPPGIMPSWYYKMWAKSTVRRVFPQKWDIH